MKTYNCVYLYGYLVSPTAFTKSNSTFTIYQLTFVFLKKSAIILAAFRGFRRGRLVNTRGGGGEKVESEQFLHYRVTYLPYNFRRNNAENLSSLFCLSHLNSTAKPHAFKYSDHYYIEHPSLAKVFPQF